MSNGFLLDTNVISERTRPLPEPQVQQWLNVQATDLLFLSAITVGEIRRGLSSLPAGERRRRLEAWFQNQLPLAGSDRVLPVTHAVADRWGSLSAGRQQRGMPLGFADGLIAATALDHDLVLVTRNTRDFAHLGLRLINPWEPELR